MPDPIQPVPENAKGLIGGAAFNQFARSANWVNARRTGQHSEQTDLIPTGTMCKVRNDSGFNLKQYQVLALGSPLISPSQEESEFRRQVTFTGALPGSDAKSKFCILASNIPYNEIGDGIVAGVVQVKVNITDTAHKYADVTSGSAEYLTSTEGVSGAQILWREDASTGVQWCIVRIGYAEELNYKFLVKFCLDEQLTNDTSEVSGTISVQYGPGEDNPNVTATFKNLTSAFGRYAFTGDEGECGYAIIDDPEDNTYQIIDTQDSIPTTPRGPVTVEGYLTGQMLKADSGQGISVYYVYGGGEIETGQTVGCTNPQSNLTGTGLFEGASGAWCKATREQGGTFRFDVMECPADTLEAEPSTAALMGAFGGGAMHEGGAFDLVVGMRDRDRPPFARDPRRPPGGESWREALRRRDQGMQNAYLENMDMSLAMHGQIHNVYDSYWSMMSSMFPQISTVGMPPHLPW